MTRGRPSLGLFGAFGRSKDLRALDQTLPFEHGAAFHHGRSDLPAGAVAQVALLVVQEADAAEALDAKDMLGSMPQGAVTFRLGAKAAAPRWADARPMIR